MTSRERFEAWWEVNYHNGNPPRFGWGYWRDGDGYKIDDDESELDCMWKAWQAAESGMAVQLDNAESKCRELAAENAGLKKFCKDAAFDADYEAELGMERGGFTDAFSDIKTPATDAFLAEVRAQARTDFIGRIEWIIRNECNPDKTEAIISELQKFSDELKLEAAQ